MAFLILNNVNNHHVFFHRKYDFSARSETSSLKAELHCNDRELKNLLGERTSLHRNFCDRGVLQTREKASAFQRHGRWGRKFVCVTDRAGE
jgi:hypothetical protein